MSAQAQYGSDIIEESFDLLEDIVSKSNIAKSDDEKNRAKSQIAELANEVMQGTGTLSDNLAASSDARIAQSDALISKQLTTVMHAHNFKKLQSSCRSLHYLCSQTPSETMLKIRTLNTTKRELTKDFKSSIHLDPSPPFKK